MMLSRTMVSKISALILFVFVPQSLLLAGGLIQKGETFVAPETVRYFTIPEAKRLLADREEAKVLKEKYDLLKQREALYEKEIQLLWQVEEHRSKAMSMYERSIQSFEASLKEARYACQVYKQMIEMQHNSLKQQMALASRNQRWSRTQRNLMFLAGFLTPLAGAWAVGRVVNAGKILSF